MYIAGSDTWRITIDEPSVLRIALYLRDVQDLSPHTEPEIPPLDPGPATWPVWARRPSNPAPPLPMSAAEGQLAADQWAQWWSLLLLDGGAAAQHLRAPSFPALVRLPAVRTLLVHHFATAHAWAEGIGDDPRIKRDHLATGGRLRGLVDDLEAQIGRRALPFDLRITVIGVATKHAWVLSRHHFLMTHQLIADDENALDWLRRRIGAMV